MKTPEDRGIGEAEVITELREEKRGPSTSPPPAAERGYFTASPRQDRMTYFSRLLLSRGASTAVLISNRKSRSGRSANPRPSPDRPRSFCIGRVVKKTGHPTNRRTSRLLCIGGICIRRTPRPPVRFTVTLLLHTR